MTIQQGFTVENGADEETAFAFAAERGFDFLELNMDHQFDRRRVDTEAVRDLAATYDLDLLVHLPYRVDVGTPLEHVREGSLRELEASIDTAVELGAETGVYHATTQVRASKWPHDQVRDCLYESIDRLTEYADERGFEAVVENVKSPFFDAGDLPDLFEETAATACLDSGHAHVTGQYGSEQADLLREYGDRISHVHLNETRTASGDEHLPVGLGKVDFEAIAEGMVETDWSGTCTHEVFTFDNEPRAFGKERFDELLSTAKS
ncbi:sugar phosphate isomerase/epimerase [Salinirubellus salinus]|uniref:Sugar phosphate isomerase/epimerase n=1 Tax=Salinirubellus salinus TaxID=1364945 RepID=A0A9E7UB65_9EURY|nr:sugar phosphate isomerase/epimerase family protein [Salinirubellus salinus]UWM54873.1 sugar phosphate isomerase/epimerase [Salinirubellus salinus]